MIVIANYDSIFTALKAAAKNVEFCISHLSGISPKPVRRFSVTQNLKDEEWAKLSAPNCGLRYELSGEEKISLPTDLLRVE